MAQHEPKPIDDMSEEELAALWKGQAPVETVPWTPELVFRYLRVSPDADRETVVTAARNLIDRDALSVEAAEVLAEHGYPELADFVDEDLGYDELLDDDGWEDPDYI